MKTKHFFLALLFYCMSFNNTWAQTPLTEAVNIKVTDINGQFHNLLDYLDNDQYVLLDFFSATCGPCTHLASTLDTVYKHFKNNQERLVLLAIDQNFDNTTISSFADATGATYPMASGIDGGGSIAFEIYEIPYYPCMVLIAPDHSILSPYLGHQGYAQGIIDSINAYGISNVGIEDFVADANDLSLSPNPATNYIEINSKTGADAMTKVMVYNNIGQKVVTKNIETLPTQLYIAEWKAGMYHIEAINNKGYKKRLKFIKN